MDHKETLSFVQVHPFYTGYLHSFYEEYPGLKSISFPAQMQALIDDGFSGIHIFAPYLGPLGYTTHFIVPNNYYAQTKWAAENGVAYAENSWCHDILLRQLEILNPDILYFGDSVSYDSRFLTRLGKKPRLVMGWRGANIPAETDWSSYDCILSMISGIRETALRLGASSSYPFSPAFPSWFTGRLKETEKTHDVVFSGQNSPTQHAARNEYLNLLATEGERTGDFTCAYYVSGQNTGLSEEARNCIHPPVFGIEMLNALQTGRISFDARASHRFHDKTANREMDIGRKETANMRIFESTGSGVFLLTEEYDNLKEYFIPGKEIETFGNSAELLDKVRYYLSHPGERQKIAEAGQARCLKDHSMESRVVELDILIKKLIGKKEKSDPPPLSIHSRSLPILAQGSFDQILQSLGSQLPHLERSKPGKVILENNMLCFSDAHSFYHESKQIFFDGVYDCELDVDEPLIVDCGAHVGLASLYFGLRYPGARIMAFEADPALAGMCAQNIASIGLPNARVFPKAVWTDDKGVNFDITGDDSGHVLHGSQGSRAKRVPSIRLKDILGRHRVDLLKMDIEGAEFQVIKDCDSNLASVKRMIIEVHFLNGNHDKLSELLSVLEENGFAYVLGDLHQAVWIKESKNTPFGSISTDRYIFTVFAWK